MKLRDIKNITKDDIYWNLAYGRSKKRSTILALRAKKFKGLPQPVFFLSTGRCGTKWFTKLLSYDKNIRAFHEPKPNLGIQGKLVYEIYRDSDFNPSPREIKLIREIFLAGRGQMLRYSNKTGKRYIETNNQITFFAPVLDKLFPDVIFVHLNRHPGEFVRSAMRRKFYVDNSEDLKRITAEGRKHSDLDWNKMNRLEKCAWQWNEINSFIERFKESTEHKVIYFDFNKLSSEAIIELLDDLNINISKNKISRVLNKRENIQKKGRFASYDEWNEKDKSSLKYYCSELAHKYNYEL